MVAWGTSYWSKMGDVVWSKVMVVVACMVSYCHATVPLYLVSQFIGSNTWNDARTKCESHGNYLLAMPRTSDQASAFKKLLTQRKSNIYTPWPWLGLYRKNNNGPFYWVDGTGPLGPKPKLAIEWYPGQPDNSGGNENCVVVRHVGGDEWGLDDIVCHPPYWVERQWACQTQDEAPPSMSVTADLVNAGDQVTLTCVHNRPIVWPFDGLIYTYRKYGSADIHDTGFSYATSDTYSLASMNVSDTGLYWCTVGGNLDLHTLSGTLSYFTLATSNSILLRVTPKTPTFSLDPPVPVTGVYADDTQVAFQCASDSAIGVDIVPTYHFIRDGIGIKSTNLTYTKNITTSDIGNYSCKVTMNGVDSAVSNIIAVKVFATTDEPTTTAESNTTAAPTTTKKPGLSPEMKVLVGIQLTGFVAALFGLLGMCIPVVFVCLRGACCKRGSEEKEEDDDEDDDEQYYDEDEEHMRKVHWESEEDEETTESTVSSIKSHAENAVNAVWSRMSGGMSALMPGVMPGVMKRGSGVDLTNIDEEGRSPDTTAPTSTSESPRGSVISRLFGSDLFVPRLSGSASPNEVSQKQ